MRGSIRDETFDPRGGGVEGGDGGQFDPPALDLRLRQPGLQRLDLAAQVGDVAHDLLADALDVMGLEVDLVGEAGGHLADRLRDLLDLVGDHREALAGVARVRALDIALVLLAEHELALSTLSVRVAASARATPASCLLAGLSTLGYRIPADLLAGKGPVRVGFEHPDAARPVDLTDNRDDRQLALSVRRLGLYRISGDMSLRRLDAATRRPYLLNSTASA